MERLAPRGLVIHYLTVAPRNRIGSRSKGYIAAVIHYRLFFLCLICTGLNEYDQQINGLVGKEPMILLPPPGLKLQTTVNQ